MSGRKVSFKPAYMKYCSQWNSFELTVLPFEFQLLSSFDVFELMRCTVYTYVAYQLISDYLR